MSQANANNAFVIGINMCGQLGLNHKNNVQQLTPLNVNLKTVSCSSSTIIYTDTNGKYWVSGANANGECGLGHNHEIEGLTQINYFELNNINIEKICTDCTGKCIFWISDKQQLYGQGNNDYFQLGLPNAGICRNTPELISSLSNVIDAQISWDCSIALCGTPTNCIIILTNWSRNININIPDEIYGIIKVFYNFREVYTVGNSAYHNNGHGTNYNNKKNKVWSKIEAFEDKYIVKIDGGYFHALYLEANGTLYSCGDNYAGQLGLGDTKSHHKKIPNVITFFTGNGIRIKDIKCGGDHCLALDFDNRVWSWGSDRHGQCGQGNEEYVTLPIMIEELKNFKAVQMKCSGSHSYVRTECDKHFLFGNNKDNQCILDAEVIDLKKKFKKPMCINDVFEELTNKAIREVYLGSSCTIIITK